ncbi:MAG: MFS transporter [Pseudonocardiales bacterium]|nr:MAG: MFS transporter [Pseudonocardiales bacterium]
MSVGSLGRLRRLAADTRPLSDRHFRRLFLGNGVSFIGFQLTAVAVAVQIYDITRSSFYVGLLGLVGLVPLIGFGLWGGSVADAVDRRLLLLVASVVTWVVTGGLFLQSFLGLRDVWLIMVLVAVQSAAFAVASPTRGAIYPRLLPRELIPAANTLTFTMSTFGMAVGPLIAGIVIGRGHHYSWAYAIDALLFTVGLYAALRLPKLPPTGEITRPGLRSVINGLRFIVTRPVLLMSFAVDIVAMVLAMPKALFPEVGETIFGGGPAIGWLYASIPIGSVLGGVMSGWIGRVRRQGLALTVAIICWGAAVALSGLAGQLWLVVALLAVGGAADLVSAVFRQTILQTYAPEEMRGRMQGVFVVVVAGGPRLGDLRAGATAAVFGATVSWVAGGVLCAVVVAVVAVCVPSFLRYDARAPAATVGTVESEPG